MRRHSGASRSHPRLLQSHLGGADSSGTWNRSALDFKSSNARWKYPARFSGDPSTGSEIHAHGTIECLSRPRRLLRRVPRILMTRPATAVKRKCRHRAAHNIRKYRNYGNSVTITNTQVLPPANDPNAKKKNRQSLSERHAS